MFRKPRETTPCEYTAAPVRALQPLPVVQWGPLALAQLGVPIVVGIHMLVVRDQYYSLAAQKLEDSGFRPTSPRRIPRPEILEDLPNPEEVIEEINASYKRLDCSTKTFEYPVDLPERTERVVLIPSSFAHLDLSIAGDPEYSLYTKYDKYGNELYPHERPLVESFVKAAVDDESIDENGFLNITSWGDMLRSCVSMMVGYLGIENDILDDCDNERAVAWFSKNFGREHEKIYGPMDRRISKRLGSGKEFAYDRRGVRLE
ncbi:uncharacterized protein BO80DRAFT_495813 [Aspergillus ibericus CBS 121593]|uniref:Uncharacterized protein n=1 Tax=Aspergillus ibericus CBS 121593 TaxID=1448316 RepID=A0A395GRI7_9EURO|nr:hypothetical protein BO80DRAFT_495813 [Aspergillus ibericus CBS 121593]RAK98171.1 hypothetical protein BO80DRAFT_495813 [Aspergillus ibericus CBS 121593]